MLYRLESFDGFEIFKQECKKVNFNSWVAWYSHILQTEKISKSINVLSILQKSGSPTPSDDTPSKKPSMKTAAAVVKRIQWDSELESEKFIVGYIDRWVN